MMKTGMLSHGMRGLAALVVAAMVLLAPACKREGCTDPLSLNYDADATKDDGSCTYAPSVVSVAFTHLVGTQPFALQTPYHLPSGRNYMFTAARFHLSAPRLLKAGGGVDVNRYFQVLAGSSGMVLDTVDPGSYTGLSFNIGVDSALNHADPALLPDDHPLSLMNPTQDHWGWSGGYVFLKLEGRVDSTAAMTGAMDKFFYFHLATDDLLTPVTLSHAWDMAAGTSHTIPITIDWGSAFTGVDLVRQSTQTNDNPVLAAQVMQNFLAGLRIE